MTDPRDSARANTT